MDFVYSMIRPDSDAGQIPHTQQQGNFREEKA